VPFVVDFQNVMLVVEQELSRGCLGGPCQGLCCGFEQPTGRLNSALLLCRGNSTALVTATALVTLVAMEGNRLPHVKA